MAPTFDGTTSFKEFLFELYEEGGITSDYSSSDVIQVVCSRLSRDVWQWALQFQEVEYSYQVAFDEDATFEEEKVFIDFFINAFPGPTATTHVREQALSPHLVDEEKTDEEEEEAQIRAICKQLRKQARANRKAERQVEKAKSRAIKRAMKEAIKKVPMPQASSVSCLPDYTPTEASILAGADEDGIVEVENTAVETAVEIVEDIVASSASHFVLPSLSTIGGSMDIDFNIFEINCCVREPASLCFPVLLASSATDIDVSMDANLNTMADDYCVRKPASPCSFVVLTPLATDTTPPSGPAESVISASNIRHLNLATSLPSLYFLSSFGEVRSAWMPDLTTIRGLANRRSGDSHKGRPKVKIKAEALHQGQIFF